MCAHTHACIRAPALQRSPPRWWRAGPRAPARSIAYVVRMMALSPLSARDAGGHRRQQVQPRHRRVHRQAGHGQGRDDLGKRTLLAPQARRRRCRAPPRGIARAVRVGLCRGCEGAVVEGPGSRRAGVRAHAVCDCAKHLSCLSSQVLYYCLWSALLLSIACFISIYGRIHARWATTVTTTRIMTTTTTTTTTTRRRRKEDTR